jgi:hypothetical protein
VKSLKIFLITLVLAPAAFAEYLPSITCFDVLNASHSLTIKTFKLLPTHAGEEKVYLANVKVSSGSNLENPVFDSLEVKAFSAGRRSGFAYSIHRQDDSEISLKSSCLYGPDYCFSPLFTGTITESSGTIHDLTCKFE